METRRPYSREMTQTARRLRKEQTPAEARLWELVRRRRCGGRRFLRQVPAGQYVLDFYCASVRLAVEVDGSVHNLPQMRRRDADRQAALEEMHIRVFRLTNAQVLNSDAELLRAWLLEAVEQAARDAPPWEERIARRL